MVEQERAESSLKSADGLRVEYLTLWQARRRKLRHAMRRALTPWRPKRRVRIR
jgi:hypothetical protein